MAHIAGHEDNVVTTNVGYTGSRSQANKPDYNPSQDLNEAMIQSAMNTLTQVRDMKNQPGGLSTTQLNPNVQFGKREGEYNYIRDKLIKGQPLTPGEQVIANFYTGNLGGAGTASGLTEYSGAMEDFKTGSAEEQEAYKRLFPNPITKIMGGVADYIKGGTLFGKGMELVDNLGGLFTGDGKIANFTDAVVQEGKDAAGDLGTMISDIKDLTPDLDKGVSAFRDFLNIKKNNSTDIAPSSLGAEMLDQGSNAGEEQLYGGRSPLDEMFANTGIASQGLGRQYMKEDMRGVNFFPKVIGGINDLTNQTEDVTANVGAAFDALLKSQGITKWK